MILDPRAAERVKSLARIVTLEVKHLLATDRRLFAEPFTIERARRIAEDEALSERVDAFVSRFGRLQDTIGDKLLPAFLAAHGERVATFTENLDRAERLRLIGDAQAWFDVRKLRDQRVHEYIEDPAVLAPTLRAGPDFIPALAAAAAKLTRL